MCLNDADAVRLGKAKALRPACIEAPQRPAMCVTKPMIAASNRAVAAAHE